MRFFFYGTLLDRDVMAMVIGRRLPPRAFVPAGLSGYTRRRVKGATYPIVIRDPRGEVPGAVVRGLSARDVGQLAAYEGSGYRIVPLTVKCDGARTTVSVFEPIASKLQPSGELWDLVKWQQRHKRGFVGRLKRSPFNGRPAYSWR